ncbi:MAG: hypothetical protein CM1200mP18_17300 [Gammaproteobacteria bacterium]|nr:MAG: hypothetical protein CM1200mP18_17300 [Gammaproteobacteria bacterium]
MFVVEADEYDTAFFDKRSKFSTIARCCSFNNLEFDHADIFNSIEDIEKQFHHLIRMVPPTALLSQTVTIPAWNIPSRQDTGRRLNVSVVTPDPTVSGTSSMMEGMGNFPDHSMVKSMALFNWHLIGTHNQTNALAAIAAANALGVSSASACAGPPHHSSYRDGGLEFGDTDSRWCAAL